MTRDGENDVADGLQLCETSSYRPTTLSRNDLRIEWDVTYIEGDSEEGRHLQATQGAAIRKVLEWLAHNPAPAERTAA
jgi:hypothetical protein